MSSRPEYICCRCGRPYGRARANQKYGLGDNPCGACRPIVERQSAARARRINKKRKRRLSQYIKWLMVEHPGSWTPSRRVSLEELNQLKTKCIEMRKSVTGERLSVEDIGIYVLRTNSYGATERIITAPGYYRVEKLNPGAINFEICCAGGIPLNSNSWAVYAYDAYQKEKYKAIQKKLNRTAELQYRKECYQRKNIADHDREFTTALICSGEIMKLKEQQ